MSGFVSWPRLCLALAFVAGASEGGAAPPRLLALDRDGGVLHVVALERFAPEHRIEVGPYPHEVVATTDGERAWVALYGDAQSAGHTLVEVDLERGRVLRRVDAAPLLRPHGLVRAGANIYFTAEMNRVIARLDPVQGRIDRVLGIGREVSHMIEIAPDGQQLFTADMLSDSISRLDFRSGAALPVLTHLAVAARPEGMAVSPDGRELWVGSNATGALQVVDLSAWTVAASLPGGSYPARVRFSRDGAHVYTIDPGTSELLVFDAAKRERIGAHPIPGVPLGLQPAATPGRIHLSLVQAGAVIEFDAQTGRELRRVELGRVSDGMALAGEGA